MTWPDRLAQEEDRIIGMDEKPAPAMMPGRAAMTRLSDHPDAVRPTSRYLSRQPRTLSQFEAQLAEEWGHASTGQQRRSEIEEKLRRLRAVRDAAR